MADTTGTIKSLDTSKDMIALDNGSLHGAQGHEAFRLQGRQKVTVSYTKAGDKMDATSIKPAT